MTMKITTKARYGSRIMLELAVGYGNGPVAVKDMALRQELSVKYVEHLMASLKNAGLVNAVHGAHGGYVLTRSPGAIKLLEVFEVLDGPLSLVPCAASPEACLRKKACVMRDVWVEAGEAVAGVLGSVTLADMAERHGRRDRTAEPIYHI